LILEFYKYYNRGLRKAISVILDDQQNKPIRTFLVRFVLDLLDWNSKGFYFFMGDMDEEVAYHDAHLVQISLAGIIKKRGRHFKSQSKPSFLENESL
jgi:hypothetical protein